MLTSWNSCHFSTFSYTSYIFWINSYLFWSTHNRKMWQVDIGVKSWNYWFTCEYLTIYLSTLAWYRSYCFTGCWCKQVDYIWVAFGGDLRWKDRKKGAEESWKWHSATAKNLRQKWLAAANSCQNRSRYSQENKQTFLATANSVIKRCSTIQLEKWDINRPKNTLKWSSST